MDIFGVKTALVAVLRAAIPRRDADVFYGFPPGLGRTAWVSVGETRGIFDPERIALKTRAYDRDVDVTVRIGSGPQHPSPADADRLVDRLIDMVWRAVVNDPLLGGGVPDLEHSMPSGWVTVQRWADVLEGTEHRAVVVDLTVRCELTHRP